MKHRLLLSLIVTLTVGVGVFIISYWAANNDATNPKLISEKVGKDTYPSVGQFKQSFINKPQISEEDTSEENYIKYAYAMGYWSDEDDLDSARREYVEWMRTLQTHANLVVKQHSSKGVNDDQKGRGYDTRNLYNRSGISTQVK